MRRTGTAVIVVGMVVLGFVVVATRYSVPKVPLFIEGGTFVWAVVGTALSFLTSAYLFWRWRGTGKRNPLAFVWALSFAGLFAMMVGYLLVSLGCGGAEEGGLRFVLKLGLLFWCYGFLAGSLYVFYPERSHLWILVPFLVFVVAVFAAAYMCCVLKDPELFEKATALMLVTPVLAVAAHSFSLYLQFRRAVFAKLIYTGFAVAISGEILSAFFHKQPLQYLGMALFDISLALFLCGFIFMRFETQEERGDDIKRTD